MPIEGFHTRQDLPIVAAVDQHLRPYSMLVADIFGMSRYLTRQKITSCDLVNAFYHAPESCL